MNKLTTPDVAGPMGRWRALAARCLNMAARGEVLPAAWQNALFVLFIAGILTYGAGFAWYMLARFDLVNLIRDASYDDAFYYFQIARNLAEGKFSTFDGGITRTNGYHPLWLFLVTPFYWVFDKEAALFAIKAFEIMLVAGGVALITAAARLARMPWYLMFAALPMLYQHRALIAGMEAAAALFMLGLFILTICLFARSPARWKWPLAAVAFALPWVRLEYIAISLATTGALCLVEWSWQERTPGASFGARARSMPALKALPSLFGSAAGLLAYFAYNRLVFGGIVPVSGATKAAWSQNRWEREGGYDFVQNFRDILQMPVFDYELLVALEACAYVLLVWWLARRSRSREDWLLLAFLACVSGLAVGHLAKFGQTVLTQHPFRHASFPWYFVPAYLMTALIIPVRCYVAIHFVHRFIGPKSRRAVNILKPGIVVVGAVFLLTKADFTSPFQSVETSSDYTEFNRQKLVTIYLGTLLTNRVLPDDSVVGSWDAGVIGYFSRFPVVNLDGLVNSYDYFHATNVDRDGFAVWDEKFIPLYRELGITHFANIKKRIFEDFQEKVLFASSPNYLGRKFYLWPIEPLDDDNTTAWIWERMGLHFDYQSDGVGLLVDGRLVQTFARECDPDELVVQSWVGPEDETVVDSWTRTQTGLCVATYMLPHNALPPVRVETMSLDDYAARLVGDSPPLIHSDWDVYRIENRLIYVKEQCGPEDVDARFFLHLYPVDANDLPSARRQHGFDNHDFDFGRHGRRGAETCFAAVPLPEYDIAAVSTGQYIPTEGRMWEGGFEVVEPADE